MTPTNEDIKYAALREVLARDKRDTPATVRASTVMFVAKAMIASGASAGAAQASRNLSAGERKESGENGLIAGIERYSDAALARNHDIIKVLQPDIAGE